MDDAQKKRELHRIAVSAIIYNSDQKYLVVKRNPKKGAFPNKWTVPGGGVDIEDYTSVDPTNDDGMWYHAAEITLRREVKEEVNLEVKDIKYLLDVAFVRPDGIPVLVMSYYCVHDSGEVKLDDENTDYAWITVDELDKYDLIKGIDEEIRMVDKILKESKNS